MAARKQGDYRAIIGYDYAAEGARRFLEGSEQVQSALRRTETELGDLGPAAAGGVRRLRAEMDRGQNDIEALHRAAQDFRKELERLDTLRVTPVIDTQLTPAAQRYRDQLMGGGGRSGGGFFDNIENFGERSGALSSAFDGGSEISNTLGFLGDLGAAARTLNPAALALTATLGVGVAAFSAYNAQLTKNIEKANTYGEALSGAFQAGSTAQIEALAEQARQQINIATATRDVLKEQAVAAQDQLAQSLDNASVDLTNFLNNAADGIFGTDTPELARNAAISVQGYNESIAAQDLIIQNAQIALDAYNHVLNTGQNQTNDNAAAFDLLRNAGEGVANQILRNLEIMQQEAAARQREIVDKQKLIVVTEEAAEATRRAARATAITEATTQLFDARTDLVEKTNDLAEKEAALAKVSTDAAAKIAQLETDAGERRNEAIAKSNDNIEKQEQEHKERLADIDRKANADIQNAIGRRDALAAFQAAQERKEQLTDEANSNRKRKQELQKSLDDQLNAIRTNLRKQTEAVRTNAANEETIKRQARDASRVALQNAQNAEVLLTKQFYTTQQNSLVTNYQQQLAIHEAGMIKIKDGIVRQYQDALQWGGGKTINTNSGNSSGKSFVTPYSPSQSGVSVVNNFNGSNLTPNQVQQIFTRSLTDAARRATYA